MADFLLPLIPTGAPQALTATAAAADAVVSVETYVTEITTIASGKATLPAGLKNGQLKKIGVVSDSSTNTCVITVTANTTALTAEDEITLSTAGNYVLCQWVDSDSTLDPHWRVIEAGNIDSFNGTASDFIA